ncbi:hypothetical protein BKA62DRAFT_776390 [Auriculariales sp. MPI-PUGE-AT-0066]|nr:hypothetical protein BKA62DRAFT_776390 [Auriculariales sp. MPI-PUGE-AT-0066]
MLRTWRGFHHRAVTCLAFNTTASMLAVASFDGVVVVFEVDDGRACVVLQFDAMIFATSVHWIDGTHIWVSASDGMVTLWELVGGDHVRGIAETVELALRFPAQHWRLQLVDTLPYYFPEAPHFVASDRCSGTGYAQVVVGFGRTFEQWGKDGTQRGSWSGRGRATSAANNDLAFAAWPLPKNRVMIIFKRHGARLWHPSDDALEEIVGWPNGELHAAHLLRPPSDESPKAAQQYFSAQAAVDSGSAVLAVDDKILLLSLSCNQRRGFAHVVHSIGCEPCVNLGISGMTCWVGLPILVSPTRTGLGTFDLSMTTVNRMAAREADLNAGVLLSQALSTIEGSISHAAAVAGDSGCHVASAHEAASGISISIWSVGVAEGLCDYSAASALLNQELRQKHRNSPTKP